MTAHHHSHKISIPTALFVGALYSSQLFTEDKLAALETFYTDAETDGRAVADRLVADGLLTPFQAECLLAGRSEGLVLGHYRVLDRLGCGGMGNVFLAEHELLRRKVALKVLADHLVRDDEAVTRFRWEVQVAAQLAHPNIVAVYDAGTNCGVHYLVMEYVDGVDLGRLVREQGPLALSLACECIRQAAMGLQHAYRAGFVHCDIKPSNFLLTRNTELGNVQEWTAASPFFTPHSEYRLVKIVDLGLARRLDATEPCQTVADDLAGSADYLAPEQACNPQNVDIRSDLYGLGCTFYFLLTGQAPFPGGAWPDKLLRHQLDQPTPLRTLRPDVPADIEAVVTRLMSKDPAERYAVPAEVAVVLHEWLAQQRTGTPAPKTRPAFNVNTTPETSCSWRQAAPAALASTAPVPTESATRRWGVLLGLACLVGLIAAGVMHYAPFRSLLTPLPAEAMSRATNYLTVTGRPDEEFHSLAAAVRAAQDGDIILLHGEGPFITPPLTLTGKALHLQAAQPTRAHLQLAGPVGPWQPLFLTDRPLHLEGLELNAPAREPRTNTRVQHLIYAEGAPIRLTHCRLESAANSGMIVLRNGPAVVIENSALIGRGPALVVEVGEAPVTLRVSGSQVQTSEPNGAALTIWAREGCRHGDVSLDLNSTSVQAGRVAAFTGLPHAVKVNARGNRLAFREALLSFADCTGQDGWRKVTRWQGQDNRYLGSTDWLRVEGQSFGVRGLEQWRGLWRDAEPGSVEDAGPIVQRNRDGS